MICPQCGFELRFYEDKCPLCEHRLEQQDYDEHNKQVKAESKVTLSDNIKDIISGKDETSIFMRKFIFFFLLIVSISILIVIGAFVPPLGHFFDYCAKLFDDFWRLFGLELTHRWGDIRATITIFFMVSFLVII